MIIVPATPQDHQALTALTKASKAYWGFEPEILETWSDELTITSEYVAENFVYKLLSDEELIGYYSYFEEGPKMVKLDNLFIEPNYIRQGYGTLLMDDFLHRVSEQYVRVTLDSEPNAVDFYANYGFEVVGQLPSKIEGRFLPVMVKSLGNGSRNWEMASRELRSVLSSKLSFEFSNARGDMCINQISDLPISVRAD